MADGQVKAIELQGIVRNQTKIGVQDGQAEDLLNLRFVNGSWRTSGDGRQIDFQMDGTTIAHYEQIYVHTNIYRHLLGVNPSDHKLYWFASIDTDNVTIRPLQSGNSSSTDPFIKSLPNQPVEITSVTGDLWITQTGHLITIIDEADDFEYFIFNAYNDTYKQVIVDVNGNKSDRSLYPYGQVHFNLYSSTTDDSLIHKKQVETLDFCNERYWQGEHDLNDANLISDGFRDDDGDDKTASKFYQNIMVELFGEATEKNQFTSPFLAVVACRLYDESFVFASNPVLLYPRQMPTSQKGYKKHIIPEAGQSAITEIVPVNSGNTIFLLDNAIVLHNDNVTNPRNTVSNSYYQDVIAGGNIETPQGSVSSCILSSEMTTDHGNWRDTEMSNIKEKGDGAAHYVDSQDVPVYSNGCSSAYLTNGSNLNPMRACGGTKYRASVIGSLLTLNISDTRFLETNSDVIKSICVFVTPQVDLWSMEADNDEGRTIEHIRTLKDKQDISTPHGICSITEATIAYVPKKYDIGKIKEKLMESPFYLLKEYTKYSITELTKNPIIDMTKYKDEGILKNITEQDMLDIESTSRATYLPKVTYMYNGRLHIANYKSYQFLGYPIDLFHLHNHNVKYKDGGYFPSNEQKVLPNIVPFNDEDLQYERGQVLINTYNGLINAQGGAAPYFIVNVVIRTSETDQVVTRYIPAYDTSTAKEGRADFIEDLNPLLTFPDTRAIMMTIYYVNSYSNGQGILQEGYYIKKKEFPLTPHHYLNIAYYIDENLKPIKLSDFENYPVTEQLNIL